MFVVSVLREGNGNPLQCSCLENSRDGGAWWAAVYGVAQSQTRLKKLSSSSSMSVLEDSILTEVSEFNPATENLELPPRLPTFAQRPRNGI